MTPIAHSAAGLLGWRIFSERKTLKTLALFLLISNLPDFDFIVYFLSGKSPEWIHQAYTHNVFFILGTAAIGAFLLRGRGERLGLILTAASHLPLDLIVLDTVPPIGFRMFYPVWGKLFYLGFFPYVERGGWDVLFSVRNLVALSLETVIFLFPVLFAYRKSWNEIFRSPLFWKN